MSDSIAETDEAKPKRTRVREIPRPLTTIELAETIADISRDTWKVVAHKYRPQSGAAWIYCGEIIPDHLDHPSILRATKISDNEEHFLFLAKLDRTYRARP